MQRHLAQAKAHEIWRGLMWSSNCERKIAIRFSFNAMEYLPVQLAAPYSKLPSSAEHYCSSNLSCDSCHLSLFLQHHKFTFIPHITHILRFEWRTIRMQNSPMWLKVMNDDTIKQSVAVGVKRNTVWMLACLTICPPNQMGPQSQHLTLDVRMFYQGKGWGGGSWFGWLRHAYQSIRKFCN